MPNGGWSDIVWGNVTLVLATVVLAVASSVPGSDRPWIWIVGSAGFMIVHTAVNAARDNNVVRRLGRDYDRVQRRAVELVADLGRLAADRYDLWMIDLYLPTRKWSLSRRWPFVERGLELSRQLSVSLVDARPQPTVVNPTTGPHGECFTTALPLLWYEEVPGSTSADNKWTDYDAAMNTELGRVYGFLSISPLIDQLGNHCLGVLAVHVQPEPDATVRALGAVRSVEGRRRILNACVELNGLLSK